MADTLAAIDTPMGGLSKADWVARLASVVDAAGNIEPLGKRHMAAFIDAGRTLLVTFETIAGIQALSEDGHPIGWEMVRRRDWSHLCLLSDGDTWFRERKVWAYFDRLIDDGFFEDFDTVIFYGAGPCGYAAAAFSVAAPGATVVAVQPQATLDPRVTEWDDRFRDRRRLDFTSRYGYAPDMLDAAATAFVLFDPEEQMDAMHAALFTRANVQQFRLRHMGDALQTGLLEMDVLHRLFELAAAGDLNRRSFATLFRARRDHLGYLRNLLTYLDARHRPYLAMLFSRNVVARMNAPRIRRRLEALEKSAAEGRFRAPPPPCGPDLSGPDPSGPDPSGPDLT